MKRLEVKLYPDPCLRIKTKTVESFTEEIEETLRVMADIMYERQGIGLAATQVGLGLSMMVIDTGSGLRACVNPEILEKSKECSQTEEGCLSFPGLTVNIARPEKIKIRAKNEKGELFIQKMEGLDARAFQHELDHLQAKLIIDYLDPVRRCIAVLRRGRIKKICEVVCNVGKNHTRRSNKSS
ncbi:MAG: peptide deformylase [Candidatus Omnitrophota bacterium]